MDLDEWVVRARRGGLSDEKVRDRLKEAGHSDDAIDAALRTHRRWWWVAGGVTTAIVLAVVLLFFALSGGPVYNTFYEPWRAAAPPEDCEYINESLLDRDMLVDQCYDNFALINKDPSLCERITDAQRRTACVSWIARESLNESLCLSPECREAVRERSALFSGDASRCSSAACREALAVMRGDAGACESELCSVLSSRSLSGCRDLSRAELCVSALAMVSEDSSLCTRLPCYYRFARAHPGADVCGGGAACEEYLSRQKLDVFYAQRGRWPPVLQAYWMLS